MRTGEATIIDADDDDADDDDGGRRRGRDLIHNITIEAVVDVVAICIAILLIPPALWASVA